MWEQFLVDLMAALIPVICTGVVALLGACTAYVSALVKAKYGEQAQGKANEYMYILENAAEGAVIAVQQSTVDALKKAGQWNKDTAELVKQQAVKIALDSLGDMQKDIQAQLKRDIPAYMAVLIEQALKNLKDSQ
jgi:hypothetical protein